MVLFFYKFAWSTHEFYEKCEHCREFVSLFPTVGIHNARFYPTQIWQQTMSWHKKVKQHVKYVYNLNQQKRTLPLYTYCYILFIKPIPVCMNSIIEASVLDMCSFSLRVSLLRYMCIISTMLWTVSKVLHAGKTDIYINNI